MNIHTTNKTWKTGEDEAKDPFASQQ